ncbi:MAG: hypothetical protein R3C61_06340 [Bacteroidia bacterium]
MRRLEVIMKIFVPICILILFLPVIMFSQTVSSPLKLGLGFAGYSYVGDLTEASPRVIRSYPGATLSLQFDKQKRVQTQILAGFGSFTEQNDLIGKSPITEITPNNFVQTSFFFADFRFQARLMRHAPVTPFIGAGAGLVFFNPRDAEGNFLGENIFTRQDGENYSTIVSGLPLFAGLEARLGRQMGLSLEYIHRFTTSDYLDNIGNLGSRKGNDAIRSVQLSVLISLAPPAHSTPQPPAAPSRPASAPLLVVSPITVPHADSNIFTIPDQLEKISAPKPEAQEQLQNFIRTDLIIRLDSLEVIPATPPLQNPVGIKEK